MSKLAQYHQAGRQPIQLEIIKDHKNGTVDLGRDGIVLISGCPLVEEPEAGSCTLIKDVVARPRAKPASQGAKPSEQADESESAASGQEGEEAAPAE